MEVRRHADEIDERLLPFLDRPAVDDDLPTAAAAAHRHQVRGKRRRDARQPLHALDDVLDTSELRVGRDVRIARHVEAHRHDRPDVEPDVVGIEVRERAHE